MRIEDLVTFAADAALAEAEASAVTARWKTAAIAEAERIRLLVGATDRFPAWHSGLGVLRLDGADKPAVPTVMKEADFAGWLAENHPEHATATVTLPASQLKALTDALEWTGITGAEVRLSPKDASTFFEDRCRVVADRDVEGAWNVVTTGQDGQDVTVPGVVGVKPSPRWVLAPDSKLKKARAEAAAEFVEEQLAGDEPATDLPAAVAEPVPPVVPWKSMKLTDLRAACVDAGMSPSGTKPELVARLEAKADAAAVEPEPSEADDEPTPAAVVALDRRRAKRGA